MICSLYDIRRKEVININTGAKLGYVDDVEINTDTETVLALVIWGRPRLFGLLGRDEDMIIKCSDIKIIGEDTILITDDNIIKSPKKQSFSFENLYK